VVKAFLKFAVAAAAGLGAAPRLFAQGCAMCYATAQAQDANAARLLDYAILTLLVPSVSLFAGVLIAAFRRREREMAEETNLLAEDTALRGEEKRSISLRTFSPLS
jgi:hypothetical protein